ncbi:hypothetical protein VYU27_000389 [Nannochloropsis oceanica]
MSRACSTSIPRGLPTSRRAGFQPGRLETWWRRHYGAHPQIICYRSSISSTRKDTGTGGVSQAPIEFQDDWKRLMEGGISINLSAILNKSDILHNEHGTVFLEAFKRTPPPSSSSITTLQRFLKMGHKTPTPDGLIEIESGRWWRWTSAEQREFIETQTVKGTPPSSPSSSSTSPFSSTTAPLTHMQKVIENPATNPDIVVLTRFFRLRHPFPFHALTTRLAYHLATGHVTLAETPWLESNDLYRWSIPFFLRVLLKLGRPLYAPLFCLKWMGLRTMVLWRSFSHFIFPSAPYVMLFAFRAIYMLAACALVTVALDELMRPAFQWMFSKAFGGQRPYPEISVYDLAEAGRRRGKRVEMGGGLSWRDRLWAL